MVEPKEVYRERPKDTATAASRRRIGRLVEWFTRVTREEDVFLFLLGYRWLSLLPPALTLLLHPVPHVMPLLVFAAALLDNFLLHVFHPRLNRLVVQQPMFLGVDLALVAVFIALTGGTASPYYLYALSPLLAAAFFFQIRGGLLAAGVFTLFYLLALGTVGVWTAGETDLLTALTHIIRFFLIALVFGYPSVLLHHIREASAELQRTHQELVRAETLAAIGRLAGQVSHEIRNPLSTVGGFARAILRKPDDLERVQRNAQIIADEVQHLEELLTDTLNLVRQPELEQRPENLHDILDHAWLLTSGEVRRNRPVVVRKIYASNLPSVHGDARSLVRAFLNVMRNAVQAMPAGGTLTVRTRRNGDQVQVMIADTGAGIPRHRLPTIFEPFVSHRAHGTGLGLSITHQIIRRHGGHIEVESEEGQGTRFTFYLPLAASKSEEHQ